MQNIPQQQTQKIKVSKSYEKEVLYHEEKSDRVSNMGIMTAAKDWKVLVDLDKQLKFPEEVHVQTDKRPDLIMWCNSITAEEDHLVGAHLTSRREY